VDHRVKALNTRRPKVEVGIGNIVVFGLEIGLKSACNIIIYLTNS
jgi:hypothetical protein